jgi:sugar (pentulose or hexulose) kinase
MAKYAAAVDQGTTSTRFMVFDHSGQVVVSDQMEHEQIYPKAGWVEHDPMEIWARTQDVIAGALKKRQYRSQGHRCGWRYQPARDHRGVGEGYRKAGLQCHRLAGHPHG